MYSSLNPILKDGLHNFNPTTYIHGTYRMKFIKTVGDDNIEENTPEM